MGSSFLKSKTAEKHTSFGQSTEYLMVNQKKTHTFPSRSGKIHYLTTAKSVMDLTSSGQKAS